MVTGAIAREVMSFFPHQPSLSVLCYMDDFGIFGSTYKLVQSALGVLRGLLDKYGFVINEKKSSRFPTRDLEWLGLLVKMCDKGGRVQLKVTDEKRKKMRELAHHMVKVPTVGNLIKFSRGRPVPSPFPNANLALSDS